MDYNFDVSDFEIKKFYMYPTSVVYRLAQYDEGFYEGHSDCLDGDVKEFFNELLKECEKRTKLQHLRDNKVAIEVVHKPTNSVLFVGYYVWNYCIGLGLNPHKTGKYILIPETVKSEK